MSVSRRKERQWNCLTLEAWLQLGEFRRFSDGDISESGRGVEPDILDGDGELFFASRKGCT